MCVKGDYPQCVKVTTEGFRNKQRQRPELPGLPLLPTRTNVSVSTRTSNSPTWSVVTDPPVQSNGDMHFVDPSAFHAFPPPSLLDLEPISHPLGLKRGRDE